METGTTDAVVSHPNPPGANSVAKSPENWSMNPREPLFTNTPKKTRPSGATIGDDVLMPGTLALSVPPFRGSLSTPELYCVANVVEFSPNRRAGFEFMEFRTTAYRVAPLLLSAI